ncbi:MAG: ATP-dependent DNA helicase RecG [Nitrospirota bacterium]
MLTQNKRYRPIYHDLQTPIQYARGVGPKRSILLNRLGIKTIKDALDYLPWRYEDRRMLKNIASLQWGSKETVSGIIKSANLIITPRRGFKIFEVIITDGTGVLRAKWFNQPFLKKVLTTGSRVILTGVVRGYGGGVQGFPHRGEAGERGLFIFYEMDNPEYEIIEGDDDILIHTGRIVPVYRVTEGLSVRHLRSIMRGIVMLYASHLPEHLPDYIRKKYNLPILSEAFREVHFPEHELDINLLNNSATMAHKRLIFDELFLLELGLALKKKKTSIEEKGIRFDIQERLTKGFIEHLPFKLTDAQQKVYEDIKKDMSSPHPMNRLIQGDVGCGKTVIAFLSMLIAVENGYQSALMSPTEILAEQHLFNLKKWLRDLGINAVLLTSALKGKEREMALRDIQDSKTDIIIGTHALIQEGVVFKRLGIAIIDEQHRFGVMQRATLRKKGLNPDVIVMTATPIPRTLALTLYGDLDISVIDELPPGRKNVITKFFYENQRKFVYKLLEEELNKGRQAYVVYPIIEESEKVDLKAATEMAEHLARDVFPSKRVQLLHGRMRSDEKESIMNSFKMDEIEILATTTVIEVGVDVPNASVMLIEHAERFGLAQLHQLRGRVGRGDYQSYCFLMASPPLSEDTKRRLKVMTMTNDGFKIAEEDLSIRGPGEFFGTKQSGLPDLRFASIVRDVRILEDARREAFRLAEEDADFKNLLHKGIKEALQKKWEGRLELIKIS